MKAVKLSAEFERDIENMQAETLELIQTLCRIPAPSHHEERRAVFVKEWFMQRGMTAEIDEAKNVRCAMGLDRFDDIVVIMAHMDTVFPDMEPMTVREENGRLYCPGVGDDTTNLAAMMMLADYLHKQHYHAKCGVLFVGNSCEEGLGNLKGCKAIMHAYGPRVKAFLSLDGDAANVCARAVGSCRWRIGVHTAGGHSFADFGKRSAIDVLGGLVGACYAQKVPRIGASTTTFNVGMISGGTSINSIAQDAEMLYEVRSDNPACLSVMREQLAQIIAQHVPEDAECAIEVIGERPCGQARDAAAQESFQAACQNALEQYVGVRPSLSTGSTDCNIPLSMGIVSACFGVYRGEGEHTREEWIEIDSIRAGMKAAASVLLNWFEKA